jgi:uncharacterized membrane protein
MAPLFVLIGVTGAVYVLSAAVARSSRGHWTTALRGGLAAMFAMTGTTHFVVLREDLIAMVPPALPAPDLLVTATGVLELAGAAGLLWRPTARWAAAGLAGLLVAMFPANVYAALSGNGIGGAAPTPLGLRTFVQVVFLASAVAVWVGLRREQRPSHAGREPLMATLPPARGPAHPLEAGAVLVSRLELRSLRDVPGFLRAALRLRRAFRASPGGITLQLAASPLTGRFWTWSSWADERQLQDYTRSRLHVQIMRHYRERLRDSTFRMLDPSQDALPTTWVEVRTLTAPVRPAHTPEPTRR